MGSGIFRRPLIFFCFSLVAGISVAQVGGGGGGGGGGQTPRELWCVAKNNAEDAALQSAIDWACGPGGADCGAIQKGGPCYDASDLQRTASFAFNDYYLKHGTSEDSCNFSNTAAVTSLNPSHDKCKFPSSLNKGSGNLGGGSATAGSDSEALSSSSYIHRRRQWWLWGSITFHLFFAITAPLF